jgi:hypothetical protein
MSGKGTDVTDTQNRNSGSEAHRRGYQQGRLDTPPHRGRAGIEPYVVVVRAEAVDGWTAASG